MYLPLSSHIVARTLLVFALFGALSAFTGAFIAIFLNGGGVPVAYLKNTPFTSYLVPGLILGVVVGGTQLAAAVALLTKQDTALLLSAFAGFGMLLWIFVELVMIQQYSWLQSAYFSLGGLELILVLVLLGIIPTFVTPLRDEKNASSTL